MDEVENKQALSDRSVALAYKRLFNSADGKIVLDELQARFATNTQCFKPCMVGGTQKDAIYGFDPIGAALRDGNRGVILHIQAWKDSIIINDDDGSEEPKKVVKVKK